MTKVEEGEIMDWEHLIGLVAIIITFIAAGFWINATIEVLRCGG